MTEKTTWYRERKKSENEQNFVGLNANGLPDEPMRKRKRSEEDGAEHHHQQAGGDNFAQQPDGHLHHQLEQDHGKIASIEVGKIKKIKNGKVEKKKNKIPEIKTVVFVPQTANSMLAKMWETLDRTWVVSWLDPTLGQVWTVDGWVAYSAKQYQKPEKI